MFLGFASLNIFLLGKVEENLALTVNLIPSKIFWGDHQTCIFHIYLLLVIQVSVVSQVVLAQKK